MKPLSQPGKPDSGKATEAAVTLNATYYYLLGQELSANGHVDEAIVAFERVRSLDPDAAYIHFALAQEYLKKGMAEEGVAMVKKAVELDPKDRDARLLLANLNATAKKFDDALGIFEQLAKENPDDEEVVLNIALLELEQKNFDVALKRLKAYLQRDPESALAYFYIGRLEQERGQKNEALKAYEKACDLKPGFVQAGTYLGFLQEEMGDRKGAIDTFAWLASQTDGARYHKKLGQLYLEDNNFAQSLEAFQNYERVDPTDLNNKVKIGLLLIENKQSAQAEKKFREVLKDAPDSENVRFYLASVYDEMKRYPEALKEFEKIPPASKLYVESLKKRAWILQSQGKGNEAWKILDKALKDAADNDAKFEEISEIAVGHLSNGKQFKEASRVLEAGLTRLPGSERLLYAKGVLLEQEKDEDGAVKAMQEILKKDPDHAAALNFVGFLWADKNVHLEEAENMIRRALKSHPNDPFITDSLGWVLYRRGRFDAALKALEQARAGAPDESVISEHIGDVLVKMGHLAEAKASYEKALVLGPEKDSDKKSLEEKISRVTEGLHLRCRGGSDAAHCSANGVRDQKEPRRPASSESR